MWHVYHLKLLILMQAQILTGSTILRKSVRFSGINMRKKLLWDMLWTNVFFFSNFQALGTL